MGISGYPQTGGLEAATALILVFVSAIYAAWFCVRSDSSLD